jgi:hypothetical protein
MALVGCVFGRLARRPTLYNTRRLIIHEDIYDHLGKSWSMPQQLRIGDPAERRKTMWVH